MADEPRAMREIHEIREQLAKEITCITPREHTVRINQKARELAEKYGFTLVDNAHSPHHV